MHGCYPLQLIGRKRRRYRSSVHHDGDPKISLFACRPTYSHTIRSPSIITRTTSPASGRRIVVIGVSKALLAIWPPAELQLLTYLS